jgi:hypothetical protein
MQEGCGTAHPFLLALHKKSPYNLRIHHKKLQGDITMTVKGFFTEAFNTVANFVFGNPLIDPPKLPFDVPPLDKIKPRHFLPALDWAIEKATAEIDAITQNETLPTFENTLLAMERRDGIWIVFPASSGHSPDRQKAQP